MATVDELFDSLIRDCKSPEDLIGRNGVLKLLTEKVPESSIQSGHSIRNGISTGSLYNPLS